MAIISNRKNEQTQGKNRLGAVFEKKKGGFHQREVAQLNFPSEPSPGRFLFFFANMHLSDKIGAPL